MTFECHFLFEKTEKLINRAVWLNNEVTFMLEVIRDALRDVVEGQNKPQDVGTNVGTNEDKVLDLLRQDSKLTAKILASTLGLTDRQVERILSKLKAEGKIVRHGASQNGYWEVIYYEQKITLK